MRALIAVILAATALTAAAAGSAPPLLPQRSIAELAEEVSGETAKRNLEGLARLHRQRGSAGLHAAVELIADRARAYGLSEVQILRFAADGEIFYGTQRSRPAWDATEAQLSELKEGVASIIASYAAEPIVLAEDSESADLTAALVDVGEGSRAEDYAGREVRGKIVLTAAQPGAVQALAVGKFGAAGIVSYAQNQPTAWSAADDNLIRWGHLETFSADKTFAFMISLRTARSLRERLLRGETVTLNAHVRAGQHPGLYEIATALIPGADPALKAQQIVFSCHIDHQRPGANDNASGCVAILEAARTLQALISSGGLPPPKRSLRFFWPPEIEGTMALLNAMPQLRQSIKAVVHMDMVGGASQTQAVFHITRGPRSLPSFIHDVAWAFADWVNEQSYRFAASGRADFPLLAPEGERGPLGAQYSAYTMGSDHDVYQDGSFAIPAIYMNDWPDRYIHTNFDSAANIDPTKLKRAAFIGAASGYLLANLSAADSAAIAHAIEFGKLFRSADVLRRGGDREAAERYEAAVRRSFAEFVASSAPPALGERAAATHAVRAAPPSAGAVYRRSAAPKGPLQVFGYDYLAAHAEAAATAMPRLSSFEGSWAGGEEYAYEALNFVDGRRSAKQVADEVAAELGPVPPQLVYEYLAALAAIGVLESAQR